MRETLREWRRGLRETGRGGFEGNVHFVVNQYQNSKQFGVSFYPIKLTKHFYNISV